MLTQFKIKLIIKAENGRLMLKEDSCRQRTLARTLQLPLFQKKRKRLIKHKVNLEWKSSLELKNSLFRSHKETLFGSSQRRRFSKKTHGPYQSVSQKKKSKKRRKKKKIHISSSSQELTHLNQLSHSMLFMTSQSQNLKSCLLLFQLNMKKSQLLLLQPLSQLHHQSQHQNHLPSSQEVAMNQLNHHHQLQSLKEKLLSQEGKPFDQRSLKL